MGKRITLGQALERVEVDLFDHDFEALPGTKLVVEACLPIEEQLEDTEKVPEQIKLIGGLLDIRLKSLNGSKKKPSTLVKEKWDAGELGIEQLLTFYGEIATAQFVRPT